jgi:integrase
VSGTRDTADQVIASVTFADLPIRTVNENHVRQWLKTLRMPEATRKDGRPGRKAGLAASTRRTRFNYVRMCLGAAVRAHVIRVDPSASITPPKVTRGGLDMVIPTPAQVRAALDTAPDGFAAFLAVCAFAGLRLGEAAGLQLGDVDFLRRTITVERQIQGQVNATATEAAPKYESARTIYIAEGLVTILARHVEMVTLHGDDGYLFSHRGFVYNRNSAGKAWRDLRSQVGMAAFTLHDLRHFYASGLIAAGCDVVTVQHALGHSTPSITLNTYSHLWPKAEERTRNGATALMATVFADVSEDSADSLRTEDA